MQKSRWFVGMFAVIAGALLLTSVREASAQITQLNLRLYSAATGALIDPTSGAPTVPKDGIINVEIFVQGQTQNFWVDFYQDLPIPGPLPKQVGNRSWFVRSAAAGITLRTKLTVVKTGTFHAWVQADTDGSPVVRPDDVNNDPPDLDSPQDGYDYGGASGADYIVTSVSIVSPTTPPYFVSLPDNPKFVIYQASIKNIGTELGGGLITVDLFANSTAGAPTVPVPTQGDMRKTISPPSPGNSTMVIFSSDGTLNGRGVENPSVPTSVTPVITYVVVNSDGAVAETDTTNNVGQFAPYITDLPDLTIQLTLTPDAFQASQSTQANIVVTNVGGTDIPTGRTFQVNLYRDVNDATEAASFTVSTGLAAGASVNFTYALTASGTGVFLAKAEVDTTDQIDEADESEESNVALVPYSVIANLPNLVITNMQVTPICPQIIEPGATVIVTATVKNQGSAPVPAVYLQKGVDVVFYPDEDPTLSAPNASMGSVNERITTELLQRRTGHTQFGPGREVRVQFIFETNRTTLRANYVAFARVNQDVANKVPESDDTDVTGGNLAKSKEYCVRACPDLIVSTIQVDDVTQDGLVTPQVFIQNIGGPLPTYPKTITVAFWKDRADTDADRPYVGEVPGSSADGFIGTVTITQADDENQRPIPVTFPANLSPFIANKTGTHTAWAVVDNSSLVAECSATGDAEGNNLASDTYTVTAVPNLTCSIESVTITTISDTPTEVPTAVVSVGANGMNQGETEITVAVRVVVESLLQSLQEGETPEQALERLFDINGDGIADVTSLAVNIMGQLQVGRKPAPGDNYDKQGTVTLNDLKTGVWDENLGEFVPGQAIALITFIPNRVPAGLKTNCTQNWGWLSIWGVVDPPTPGFPTGALPERNENDNVSRNDRKYQIMGRPDLIIQDLQFPSLPVCSSGGVTTSVPVTITVRNRGNASTLGTTFDISLFDSATNLGTNSNPVAFTTVSGCITETVRRIRTTINLPDGNNTVWAYVDSDPNNTGQDTPPAPLHGRGDILEGATTQSVGESNNAYTAGRSVTVKVMPDLSIQSITVTPTVVPLGSTMTVTITVYVDKNNTGAGNAMLRVLYDQAGQTTPTVPTGDEAGMVDDLPISWPASPVTETVTTAVIVTPTSVTPITSPATMYYVKAFVDPGREVEECDETNNGKSGGQYKVTAPPPPTPPDLYISSVITSPVATQKRFLFGSTSVPLTDTGSSVPTFTVGEAVTVKAMIVNAGQQPARNFWVDLYKDRTASATPSVRQAGDAFVFISSLPASSVTQVQFHIKLYNKGIAPSAAGEFKMFLQVDADGNVAEANEGNNIAVGNYNMRWDPNSSQSLSAQSMSAAADGPAVVWATEPPADMAAGMNYAVKWIVRGGEKVDATYVVMSTDPDPAKAPLAVTEEQAGDPGVFRAWVPAPSTGTLYYQVIAVVDGKQIVSQVIEGASK